MYISLLSESLKDEEKESGALHDFMIDKCLGESEEGVNTAKGASGISVRLTTVGT